MSFLIKDKYDSKTIIFICVFGCLWGFVEITLGTLLKSFRFPFSGAVLAGLAGIIISVSSALYYKKGTVFLMGVVAATLKLIYVGHSLFGPVIAILFEAAIGEIIIRFIKNFFLKFTLTGIFLCVYSLIHLFVNNMIIYGIDLYRIYIDLTKQFVRTSGLGEASSELIIFLFILIYIVIGALSGLISFLVVRNIISIKKELQNENSI